MDAKAARVEQISIFLSNRPGVVADLCAALTEQHINIRALTVLDTTDIGTFRMVVDDAEQAKETLQVAGASYVVVPVMALPIKNAPGAFSDVARIMADNGVNIEYVYASAMMGTDRSLGIFRVSDLEKALSLDYP
ncbi:MAG: ACT domain-containing protein [Phycisphaerae bacterium]